MVWTHPFLTASKRAKMVMYQPFKPNSFKTPRGYINVATPEVTAMDLVTYPKHSGGLSQVATVFQELM